jgi:hypothetical protein
MTIQIKLRRKYIVGKLQSGPYKPRTGQSGNKSIWGHLFASWKKHEPGKSLHAKEVERQKNLPKRVHRVK